MKRVLLALGLVLAATPMYAESIGLTWTQAVPTVNVVSNNVYRSETSGGPYTQIFVSPTKITAYTDSTVAVGSTYCYVVTAIATNGAESVYSNEACKAVVASNPPTNLRTH